MTAAAESILRSGHPWLFAESIREQNRPGQLGELAVVFDRHDRFLAVGLYDPGSSIRLRVLHAGKPQAIDRAWWAARLRRGIESRSGLFDAGTTGFRWLNGESDGWPGLVLDRYGQTLVLKLYTAAWLPHLEEIAGVIAEQSSLLDAPSGSSSNLASFPDLAAAKPAATTGSSQPGSARLRLVLRLSRNIQETARTQFGRTDGEVLLGPALEGPVVFLETGLRFEADVARGQKTGFFLDQRENRRRVETLARERRVLNAFSFSGGFSLYAARGGARSVTDLDISAHALESARRNFRLNESIEPVAACEHQWIQADAFDWLGGNPGCKFDLVILDPPSLAKRETERAGALRAYNKLAAMGIEHLDPGGVLVACSCSAHVSADEFFESVRAAAAQSGREFSELQTARHAPDHPAAFKEAEYLKVIYLA